LVGWLLILIHTRDGDLRPIPFPAQNILASYWGETQICMCLLWGTRTNRSPDILQPLR